MNRNNYLRFLWATALTASLTVACSDNDTSLGDEPDVPEQPSTPEPERVPITFTTTVNTKGTELDNQSFATFTVFALNDEGNYIEGMTNEGAVYTRTESTWKASTSGITWPTDGSAVHFYAISGNEAKIGEGFDPANKTYRFVVDEDVNHMDDILVCYQPKQTQTSTDPATGSVLLTFNHLTTALQFQVTNNLKAQIDIKNFELRNVAYTALYAFADGTLTLDGSKTNYTLLNTTGASLSIPPGATKVVYGKNYPMDGTDHYLYVLPQTTTAWDKTTNVASQTTGTYLYIKLRVDDQDADQEIAIPVGATWKPHGNKLYTIRINATAIGLDGSSISLQ